MRVTDACVYSQSYWLSDASKPWPTAAILNQSLCGLSWHTLMHLNTSQTREPGAMHWLLAFHQLCTACLNHCKEEETQPTPPLLPSSITLSIEVIFDSMQRSCHDMYRWTQEVARDQVLSGNLKRLIEYNHGAKVCKPVLFSFTYEPQLFFLGYNETEQSETLRQATERQRLYKTQTVLGAFLVCAILLIVGLVLYIIIIHKKRRDYSFFRAATEPETYNASGCDQNVIIEEEEHGSFEDIDFSASPRTATKTKQI